MIYDNLCTCVTHILFGKCTWFGRGHCVCQVYVNGLEEDIVDFTARNYTITLKQQSCDLDILVENMGRVNYAEFNSTVLNNQRKGRVFFFLNHLLKEKKLTVCVENLKNSYVTKFVDNSHLYFNQLTVH